MADPTPPSPSPAGKPARGSGWLPWILLLAGAGLLVLRWMGMLGPC